MGCGAVDNETKNCIDAQKKDEKYIKQKIELKYENLIRDKYTIRSVISFDSCKALYSIQENKTGLIQTMRVFYYKNSQNSILQAKFDASYKKFNEIAGLEIPYIIPFICAAKNQTHFYAIYHTSNFPNFAYDALINGFIKNEEDLKKSMKGIFEAIFKLHSQNIIHGEINPWKILCDNENKFHLYDFTAGTETSGQLCLENIDYIAPEIIEENKFFTKENDIYSLGKTLQTFLSIFTETDISENLIDLVMKMTDNNPNNRITIQDILYHPWLKDISTSLPLLSENGIKNLKEIFDKNSKLQHIIFLISNSSKLSQLQNSRELLISLDDENTGIISLLDYTICLTQNSSKLPEISIGNLKVNYMELLAKCMSLSNFIITERYAELFYILSNKSTKLDMTNFRKLFTVLGMEEFSNSSETLESVILSNKIIDKIKTDINFDEFKLIMQFLDTPISEDIFTFKELYSK